MYISISDCLKPKTYTYGSMKIDLGLEFKLNIKLRHLDSVIYKDTIVSMILSFYTQIMSHSVKGKSRSKSDPNQHNS